MKKFKWVWILGISAGMFLGPLGVLDLSGQQPPNWIWPYPNVKIRESVEKSIISTDNILEVTIRRLNGMSDDDILRQWVSLTQPFMHTHLKFPELVDQGVVIAAGWNEVIWKLKEMAPSFEHLATTQVRSFPSTGKSPDEAPGQRKDFDYRFGITTELILHPPNNPSIRGCLLHRTSCYPEECL